MHYILSDSETAGLYPSIHALLSLGACCTWSGETFQVYITPESQPGKTIDPESLAKNGYSEALWKAHGAVSLSDGFKQFLDWIDQLKQERHAAKLVCHNLAFDRSFFSEAERVTGYPIPHRHDWRCSQVLFGQLMDKGLIEQGSSSLDRLAELSGWTGERTSAHNALQDAEITRHGLLWLLKKEKGPEETLRQLYTEGLKERRVMEDALHQLSVWQENGQAEGRVSLHLLEEMTCLAKSFFAEDYKPSGSQLISLERWRQITVEGFDAAQDIGYINGELRDAGIAYAMVCDDRAGADGDRLWPFQESWWKPSDDPVRNLIKAGALFAAEIDRLKRKEGRDDLH